MDRENNLNLLSMKFAACLLFCLTAFAVSPVSAQTPQQQPAASAAAEPRLTKFDLDFPGGTPAQLVAAIQKAMGRPLNAIIPSSYADRQLPALKMTGVDVEQLFVALMSATNRTVPTAYPNPDGKTSYIQQTQVSMGFATRGRPQDRPQDDSIWYFYAVEPPAQPQSSRFYLLSSYLDRGLTVDDITTAIQTAWKMQGDGSSVPQMSFHKETKLLIAAGDVFRLNTIDLALAALDAPEAKPAQPANAEAKKP